jgi:hypothetical protein
VGTESGKESTTASNRTKAHDATDEAREEASTGTLNAIPEMMRRAVAVGLSGFFLTEEAIRKAVGDTLPRDWADFAVEQSERTRSELMDRLSVELSRTMENLDVTELFGQLVEGRTIEVKAEIRLKPRDEEAPVASGSRGKDT